MSECKKKLGEACETDEASSLQDRYSVGKLKTQSTRVSAKKATDRYKTTKSNSREKSAMQQTGNGIVHKEDKQV